ncbi:hypothetical protein N657DRAFT_595448 [Parathielavia appendiculata]|uniref:Uncharacterized protein n=1 Tax=Parathielavia appendiculata TaxID=2587402 RepID=A0AAN6U189_9PEZI|nr:hypothetical protein N657DRAFT_595448 [Parathielavia appendiculata]
MSVKSSYLPRLGFSRGDEPILPLHHRMSPPIRKQPSEYDLSELPPQPDDDLLASMSMHERKAPRSRHRSPSPSARYSDRGSTAGSSKSQPKQRVLFAGPPPPVAVSQVLYRDEEERDTPPSPPGTLERASFARNINSVLFDRSFSSPNRPQQRDYDYRPEPIWHNLQRREHALQRDLQHLLDAQSAGLAANLDPNAPSPSSATSDRSGTTSTSTTTSTPRRSHHYHPEFEHTITTSSSGTLVPVRQPQSPKSLGLRAARASLARTITQLADLKAEEDAQLTTALSARKKALSRLRQWTAQRADIAEELRALEAGDGDGELHELRELEAERKAVQREIVELEERLVGLRRRRTVLDGRVEEVRSRREAGLSGYRGALREVEGRIGGLLARPGVRPLDGEFFFAGLVGDGGGVGESPGGMEFLRLRPERRTAEMAREWWEKEVGILERRKAEVDKEKAALEEGAEVWKGAVKLVSEFEAGLRREMRGGEHDEIKSNGKGKAKKGESSTPPPSEQAMYAQLDKMRAVMAGLDEKLHVAEENGWNLLICAIGAELEAFRQAEGMLREALRSAGFDIGEDDAEQAGSTPRLGRSTSLMNSGQRMDAAEPSGGGKLLDLHDGPDEDKEAESDNDVPRDLLVAVEEEQELANPALNREDSNEVPAEFLTEHHDVGEGFTGFGGMT